MPDVLQMIKQQYHCSQNWVVLTASKRPFLVPLETKCGEQKLPVIHSMDVVEDIMKDSF